MKGICFIGFFRNLVFKKVGWVERSLRNLNWVLMWDLDDDEGKKRKSKLEGVVKREGNRFYVLEF